MKWCKLDSAGDVLCQEATLTFRRCKIPAPCQLSVMPHWKYTALYTCILTVSVFHNFNSVNLMIFNFVIVSVAIALKQSSPHSVRFCSFIYVHVYIYLYVWLLTFKHFISSCFVWSLRNVCYWPAADEHWRECLSLEQPKSVQIAVLPVCCGSYFPLYS